jgi:hypothetical protein
VLDRPPSRREAARERRGDRPPSAQLPPGRSASPDAIRARNSRARLKAGVRTFRVQAHIRRLAAAMRRANPRLGDDLTSDQIETELNEIVAAFTDRWLGKKPFA